MRCLVYGRFCLIVLSGGLIALSDPPKAISQSQVEPITVDFCDLTRHPSQFHGQLIRVRALYKVGFEESTIVSPSCVPTIPRVWVDFDDQWEMHTRWIVRHTINSMKFGTPKDVVLVGSFRSGGRFGHMDMYSCLLKVISVEAAQPNGHFRPLPDQKGHKQ
jgi:hypothetical protein